MIEKLHPWLLRIGCTNMESATVFILAKIMEILAVMIGIPLTICVLLALILIPLKLLDEVLAFHIELKVKRMIVGVFFTLALIMVVLHKLLIGGLF